MSTTPATTLAGGVGARLGAYAELTKPRLSMLVVSTALVAYVLAPIPGSAATFVSLLVGTAFIVGGANAINQVLERAEDSRMHRTRNRPLPAGRIGRAEALLIGAALGTLGFVLLWLGANPLAAFLGAAGLLSYAFVYTPLKRRTSWCTPVGAVPGAIPALIGWSAATGSVQAGGLALFSIVFFWQMPHFLAIARLHREDYRRAGMPMLGVEESGGSRAGRHMVAYCLALLPTAALPWALGLAGQLYLVGATALGLIFLGAALQNLLRPSRAHERAAFLASLVYLSGVLVLLLADRTAGA